MKTRFAPSPTGRLHLGNARTALFNALLAWRSRGVFLLRIEDTDARRSEADHLDALLEDLRWLGLHWQEGHACGGEAGPYRQSERGALYGAHLRRLEASGHAYPCFCSPEALARARAAQLAAGRPPRYPGTCAELTEAGAKRRLDQGEPAALRFRVPRGRAIEFTDLVRGPQHFASDDIGDFVIRRTDGSPAFFFCNAVDDALMGVTHVLRGDDHLSNTPRQLMLLEAMGYPAPAYGHVSLVLAPAGTPLSKRSGSASLRDLRARGYLPAAIINYLARLGHSVARDGLLSMDELTGEFDLQRVAVSAPHYDPVQLDHWQRLAVSVLPGDAFWRWSGPGAQDPVPVQQREDLAGVLRGFVRFPDEAVRWVERLYGLCPDPAEEASLAVADAGLRFLDAAESALDASGGDFKVFVGALKNSSGRSGRALFAPLRGALTGVLEGPELARIFTLLGPDRLRDRLRQARAWCGEV